MGDAVATADRHFRGSGGYGKAFAEAGHRQRGQRMQDDVTDAVEDLVKQGLADRSRIVIYGASYGGWSPENELKNLEEIVDFFKPHLAQRAAAN